MLKINDFVVSSGGRFGSVEGFSDDGAWAFVLLIDGKREWFTVTSLSKYLVTSEHDYYFLYSLAFICGLLVGIAAGFQMWGAL
jgi:hypothetical protein